MDATPPLLDLVAPARATSAATGVYASSALAETIAPAATVRPVLVPPTTVIGTYEWPDDGRPAPLHYAALAPAPPVDAFDQCWVRATDPQVDPSYLLRSVTLHAPLDPSQVKVGQLNPTLGEKLTAPIEFEARSTRWCWAAAAVAGLLLAMALIWLRRLELASAREVGVPIASQVAAAILEAEAWAVAACVLATPYLLMRANALAASDQGTMALLTVPIGIGALCGVGIGTMLAVWLVVRRPVEAYLRTR